jgi:ubiquinone biosynthesis protein COQ9
MRSPLAESQRDALIEAMLPDVVFDGWSRAALRAAARRIGMPTAQALALFGGGPAAFVACFSRWADRRMLDRLETAPLNELRVPERIALAVTTRLEIVEPWREATRRALVVLALPQHAPLAMRLLYETVDGIWYAAGDSATDFSFYTKRLTLAGIYAATLLYWFEDRSDGFAETRALPASLALATRVAASKRQWTVCRTLCTCCVRCADPSQRRRPTSPSYPKLDPGIRGPLPLPPEGRRGALCRKTQDRFSILRLKLTVSLQIGQVPGQPLSDAGEGRGGDQRCGISRVTWPILRPGWTSVLP